MARTVQSLFGPFLIGTRFAEEQAAAAPLPDHRFDPCVIRPAAAVDKYQTVAFDRNRYSVPRSVRVPDGDGQGLRRPGRDRGRRPGRRDPQAVPGSPARRSSTRSITSRLWAASRVRWTMPRCTGTGSSRPASPSSAPSWRSTTGRPPARGGSCGSCNSWSIILWTACVRRSRTAAVEQLISAEAVIQRTRTLAACESQTRSLVVLDHGADHRAAGPGAAP